MKVLLSTVSTLYYTSIHIVLLRKSVRNVQNEIASKTT